MIAQKSLEHIEETVARCRRVLDIADVDTFDIVTLLETKVAGLIKGFELLAVPDEELTEGEACYDASGPKITVRQSVYNGARRQDPRHVFTLVHEYGHVVLSHQGRRLRACGRDYRAENDAILRLEEREAMDFASIFMAPGYLLNPSIPAREISRRFNMSAPAASLRKERFDTYWRRKNKIARELPANVIDLIERLKNPKAQI